MADRIRLCFVGPMTGRHKGHFTSQGLLVADWLAQTGTFSVVTTSAVRNRYLRLADILTTLARAGKQFDIQCLEVYAGRSFVVEDLASALGKAFGQRIVMVLHGGALPTFMARYPSWARRVLRRADVLVAPSTYLERAVTQLGLSARVIPNVLDLSNYPFSHRVALRPRLFWMRSFHPIWNPEMALRVLARVKQRLPEATLVLAGPDKGTQNDVKKLARSLGVTDAVRFPGFLEIDGKIRESTAADIFLNTNRIDNMPVAVVEACAMGLPVVSTNVGGIPDLLEHEYTGLLVPDNDDEAMAVNVLRLLEDRALASRLSENGRRLAERFGWSQVRPQWERLFSDVHSGKVKASPEFVS